MKFILSHRLIKTLLTCQYICVRNLMNTTIQLCQLNNKQKENDYEKYDIIISGGGMVGFAAACALGQNNRLTDKRILLLEKQPNRSWSLPDEFSNRVCSLNNQTKQLFKTLGAWDIIKEMRIQPVKKMQVWESCSEAMITFHKQDIEDRIAYIVENDVVLDALKRRVSENVEVKYGTHVIEYELPSSSDQSVNVTLHDGEKVSTDLLVGADGAHSGVRKAMGCKYLAWEYDQMGIVATLQLSEEQDNFIAWQKFISTGPIALLPLSSTRSSLVWSTTKKNASALLALSELEFIDELNNAIWRAEATPQLVKDVHERWQSILQIACSWSKGSNGVKQLPPSISGVAPKTRASFSLGLGHAAHYVAPRVSLIGDAAHRVHPLAGQGVNLGFGDVVCLRDTLAEAVMRGSDIGDFEELRRYETTRQRHNVSMIAATDALYRLYSTSFAPVVLLRSLGLSAVEAMAPLKKRIMDYAEG